MPLVNFREKKFASFPSIFARNSKFELSIRGIKFF
jgi:hypothetical protein